MNLILIPGNSPSHKEWIDTVRLELAPLFEETRVLYYSHWETGEPILNFDTELAKVTTLAENFGEYMIFAKSAGTLLTTRGARENKLHPVACLFTGVPVTWAYQNAFPVEEWLQDFSIPTTYIHQTFDRTCSIVELKEAIKKCNISNETMVEVEGNDHQYNDFDLLRKEAKKLLAL